MRLVEDVTGRVLGTVDAAAAHGTAHAGAVYLHQGETWLVTELDLEESVAVVVPADPDYSTSAREITDIEILAEREAVTRGAPRASAWATCGSPTRWSRSSSGGCPPVR